MAKKRIDQRRLRRIIENRQIRDAMVSALSRQMQSLKAAMESGATVQAGPVKAVLRDGYVDVWEERSMAVEL